MTAGPLGTVPEVLDIGRLFGISGAGLGVVFALAA